MSIIVFLFLLGLLMLSLEIFLPGGVLGVMGGLAMIVGVVLAFRDYGTGGGALALFVALVLVAASVITEFVVLPKTRWGRNFYLASAVTGVATAPADATTVTGRECEALTVLAPSGQVLLDGKRYEAFCRDGYAERGARLKVQGSDNFRLIVSKSWK